MKRRTLVALVAGAVTFSTLAGTLSATALWSTQAQVGATVTAASLEDNCEGVTSVVNAGFEEPRIPGTIGYATDSSVPGWTTSATDRQIEFWAGYDGVPAGVGRQFVELNANQVSTLSQTIATTPGQTLQWSLLHRGRTGEDTMALWIGPENGAGVLQTTIKTGTTWTRYSGAYTVPAGQTRTTLGFESVATASGNNSIGNFLDDVSFGSGPCVTAGSTVSNITNPNGAYRVGDVVQFSTAVANAGSSPSMATTLAGTLPDGLTYRPGSLTVDGTSRTDAAGDDLASYVAATRAVQANLGFGANGSAGGSVAQGTTTTVTFQATVGAGTSGRTLTWTPTGTYVNGLAPRWGKTFDAAPVSLTVAPSADLALTSSATTATGSATWSFAVTNNGPAVATGTVVRLTLPQEFASAARTYAGTGVSCAAVQSSTTVVDCTLSGSITVGETRRMTATVDTRAVAAGQRTISATVRSAVDDTVTTNNSASAVVTVADTTAPGVPSPRITGRTQMSVTIAWPAVSDDTAVAGYDIYRFGTRIATVRDVTTFTDRALRPNTPYGYSVVAFDAAGNRSAMSTQVQTTTPTRSTIMAANGSCIVANNNIDDILLGTCGTTSRQAWQLIADGDNYRIRYDAQDKYWSTRQTTDVWLYPFANGTDQRWGVIQLQDGSVQFKNRDAQQLCLSNTAGTALALETCAAEGTTALNRQRFTLGNVAP